MTLVTALGRDPAGARLRSLLDRSGVQVLDLGLLGPTPEKVRLRTQGRTLFRLDRGGSPGPVGPLAPSDRATIDHAAAVLVADYGRGVATATGLAPVLSRVALRRPMVWDPHLKGSPPPEGTRLVTPNRRELQLLVVDDRPDDLTGTTARARELAARWRVKAVCVTLGAAGALLVSADGPPLAVPARATAGDTCGAGDRLASAVTSLLGEGALLSEAVIAGVRAATAHVGGEPAPASDGRRPAEKAPGDPETRAGRVRATGGIVVATGGCFDLLHAGHIALLSSARDLGDHLIVCLNSDRSVRRLKGADRPVVPATERAAVLRSLGCVDEVVVFEEDTPAEILRRLRPHVFVKGGDYAVGRLPEAGVLAEWGGQAVVVPYLEGRSTSRLLERIGAHGR